DECLSVLRRAFPPSSGPSPEAARPHYLRYKPGTGCLAAIRVGTSRGEFDVYARAWRHDASDKLNNVHKREIVPGPLGPGVVVLPDLGMTIHSYPNDHELTALSILADAPRRSRLLAKSLPGREELVDRPLELLRYKPERRFVGRVLDSHGRGVVLRCYDDDGFAQATRAAAALSRAGLMTGLLATVAHRRVALWEWIPGRTGAELLRSGEAGRA